MKWFYTLINIIAVVLIIASVFVLLTVVMTPAGQAPQVMGFSILRVLPGSMEPAISVGDLVYVRQAKPEAVEENDVIAFFGTESSDAIILHRVVENRTVDGSFITKGDANAQPDLSPVSYDRLLGVTEWTIPHLGQLGLILTDSWGKLAAVCLVLAAVMLHAVSAALRAKQESFQSK